MGLFGLFKKKKEYEMLNVSGKILVGVLDEAVETAKIKINGNYYGNGPEVMFNHGEEVHFIGVKYDTKQAKKQKLAVFDENLLSVYLDKQVFTNTKELLESAVLDGILLKNINHGIELELEYAEMVEKIKSRNNKM